MDNGLQGPASCYSYAGVYRQALRRRMTQTAAAADDAGEADKDAADWFDEQQRLMEKWREKPRRDAVKPFQRDERFGAEARTSSLHFFPAETGGLTTL